MLAQVPSPTPSLMQWTRAEPTSGSSSLPVQGMDCDTTGCEEYVGMPCLYTASKPAMREAVLRSCLGFTHGSVGQVLVLLEEDPPVQDLRRVCRSALPPLLLPNLRWQKVVPRALAQETN